MKVFAPLPRELENLAQQAVDASIKVHKTLGPGLLESVYETCLAHELRTQGLQWKLKFQFQSSITEFVWKEV